MNLITDSPPGVMCIPVSMIDFCCVFIAQWGKNLNGSSLGNGCHQQNTIQREGYILNNNVKVNEMLLETSSRTDGTDQQYSGENVYSCKNYGFDRANVGYNKISPG